MGEQVNKLVFLPTNSYDPSNPWLPNDRAIKRIEAARETLKQYPEAWLVIAGGYANHLGVTYADRMAYYIDSYSSEMMPRLKLIGGLYNRTVDDVFQGMLSFLSFMEQNGYSILPAETTLFFCSELPHYLRTARTIEVMGFEAVHIESGGDQAIYDERDLKLAREFVLGKILGLGQEALEWNRIASINAADQAEYCRKWAEENPSLDKFHHLEIVKMLRRLSKEGVLIESRAIESSQQRLPIPRLI